MEHNASQSSQERWVPLESNCEVFTDYFKGIGLKKEYFYEELLSFSYQDLQCDINKQTQSVIAIFQKLKPNSFIYDESSFSSEKEVSFYMKQNDSLMNACGLVAGLQSIGNLGKTAIESGSLLGEFLSERKSSEEYTHSLSQNKEWKEYHTKAALVGNSIIPENPKDVNHHYVTFIYNSTDSFVYELDGRLDRPYRHTSISSKEALLDQVIEILAKRLEANTIMPTIALLLLLKTE